VQKQAAKQVEKAAKKAVSKAKKAAKLASTFVLKPKLLVKAKELVVVKKSGNSKKSAS
jgi:hypothetical protein